MHAALPERNLLPTVEFSKSDHTEKGLSQIIKRPTGAKFDAKAKETYIRKRNAMYARRRAQKIKIQQVALEDRKEILETENKRLKRENEKLELLLARARVHVSFEGAMNRSSPASSSHFSPTPRECPSQGATKLLDPPLLPPPVSSPF